MRAAAWTSAIRRCIRLVFPEIVTLPCHFPFGDRHPHVTLFLGPSPLIIPNGISIGSVAFYESQMLCCTMHCQWGRKPPKLPLPLGILLPAGGGPSDGLRQHAQKLVEVEIWCGSGDIVADRQTDTHTHTHTQTYSSQYYEPLPRAKYIIRKRTENNNRVAVKKRFW